MYEKKYHPTELIQWYWLSKNVVWHRIDILCSRQAVDIKKNVEIATPKLMKIFGKFNTKKHWIDSEINLSRDLLIINEFENGMFTILMNELWSHNPTGIKFPTAIFLSSLYTLR